MQTECNLLNWNLARILDFKSFVHARKETVIKTLILYLVKKTATHLALAQYRLTNKTIPYQLLVLYGIWVFLRDLSIVQVQTCLVYKKS